MPSRLTLCVTLLLISVMGTAQGQVARYSTTFAKVTMPTQVGQQVVMGSLPLDGLLLTTNSFDVQASGVFHGDWAPEDIVDLQESFDLYLCDQSDCSGSTRAQVAHLNLVPFALSECLDGVLTLHGTVVKNVSGFTGMTDGTWTGKIIPGQNSCDIRDLQWADGFTDRYSPSIATGPTGALPWVSAQFVNTSQNLFLTLITTLAVDNDNGLAQGTGQIRLMRMVVYP
jgi:hypothetical protein